MKSFRFSLTSVRDLRETEEQTAQKVFADAMRACDEASMRVLMVDRELQKAWQAVSGYGFDGVRADQMRHARAWCLALDDQRKQLVAERAACQRTMESARQSMQWATQRRETLDRLMAKQRQEYERELQSNDQKFLDELATRGAWRGADQMEAA